jgi:hypothetical protein
MVSILEREGQTDGLRTSDSDGEQSSLAWSRPSTSKAGQKRNSCTLLQGYMSYARRTKGLWGRRLFTGK